MFVNVELGAASANGVVVPDSAILDTGTRQLVFVGVGPGALHRARGEGRARGRTARRPSRQGSTPGERVATSANFLLDSESRLRNAVRGAAAKQPQEQ